MNWLKDSYKITNSFLTFGALAALIVILMWLYLDNVITDPRWAPIISGLLTGFIVAGFQLFLSVRELKKMDKYDAMGIIAILPTRDDPHYYRELVDGAKDEIKILGVTCKRFLDDFANLEEHAPVKNRALIRALDNGVQVKILVADESFLHGAEEKQKAASACKQMTQLKAKYKEAFQYVIYSHEPQHSIVVVDRQSIVGPSFPNVSSKFSPAIHLREGSAYSGRYLEYFDREWDTWNGKLRTE